MSCPHSLNGTPDRCSQCLPGVRVRRVEQTDTWLIIDGKPIRQIAEVQAGYGRRYQKRK